jgi:hemerythrin-like domain-containing protein
MPKKQRKAATAVELFQEDHDYIRRAYRRFEKMDHGDRAAVGALVTDVCAVLETHARLEEEVFFPVVRKALDDDDLMTEAEIQHEFAKTLIRRLRRMKPQDAAYVPTFTVLCEYFRHHAKQEETEIFPKAKRRRVDMRALGRKIMERRLELEESG